MPATGILSSEPILSAAWTEFQQRSRARQVQAQGYLEEPEEERLRQRLKPSPDKTLGLKERLSGTTVYCV